jgi:hypothetical protein
MSQRRQKLQERLSVSISSDVYKFLLVISCEPSVNQTRKFRRNLKPTVHVYLNHRHKIYTDLSKFSYTCILRRALFYSIMDSPCEITVFIDFQM